MNNFLYPLITLVIGYLIKAGIDKRHEFTTKNAEIKRSAYAEMTELILDLFSQDKLGKLEDRDMVKRLNSFNAKCILYGSPEVVNAYGDMMQALYSMGEQIDTGKNLINITKLLKAMRQDIGLSNLSLGLNGEKLLRAKFTDYDKIFGND